MTAQDALKITEEARRQRLVNEEAALAKVMPEIYARIEKAAKAESRRIELEIGEGSETVINRLRAEGYSTTQDRSGFGLLSVTW